MWCNFWSTLRGLRLTTERHDRSLKIVVKCRHTSGTSGAIGRHSSQAHAITGTQKANCGPRSQT